MKNKQYLNSMLHALRDLDNIYKTYEILDHQQTDKIREVIRLSQSHQDLARTLGSSRWFQMKSALDTLPDVNIYTKEISQIASIEAELANIVINCHEAVLPKLDDFDDMIHSIVKPFEEFHSNAVELYKDILEQAERLTKPWALLDAQALSVSGFTKLSCLSYFAHSNSPFEGESASFYHDQLYVSEEGLEGSVEERDKAAVECGLNPELIAFLPREYSRILSEVGFSISFPDVADSKSEEFENKGEACNPLHNALLNRVENLLRELIEQKLSGISGESWIKKHVRESKIKEWNKKRQIAQKSAGKQYGLIYYSNFMDLADVICCPQNWDNAFCAVFSSKEDFCVSMTRLRPIRNSIAHSRPLARSEELTLVAEAFRILTVLRREFEI